jgi:hypothetical protein
MNAITDTRAAPHNAADWPPVPGLFRVRMVRGGPFVGAEIKNAMGFWSAAVNGEPCGAHDPDPMQATGVDHIWEFGTRVSDPEFAELLANAPASPDRKIDLGAEPPITFAPPPVGHNRPLIDLAGALEPEALTAWIGDRFTLHTERGAALLAGYRKFLLVTHAGIPDVDVATRATELVRQIKLAVNETDSERVRIKAPVLAAQRAIDGAAGAITGPLVIAFTECERRVSMFMVERDRQTRMAAAEMATRAAASADLLTYEAVATGDAETTERAVEVRTEQHTASAIVQAPLAELTRLRPASGKGTAALRDNWTYTLADISKVPAHLIMLNDAAVKAQIKAAPKGTTPMIPGLTITNNPKVGIR